MTDGVTLLSLIFRLSFVVIISGIGNYVTKIDGSNNFELIREDIFFEILEPEDLSYTYRTRPARNFGSSFNSSWFSSEAYLVPAVPRAGCDVLYNSEDVRGNVALIERGLCSFVSKAINAEEAGAVAVIISDNYDADDIFTEMIEDETGREVHIPATFLLGKNGYMIRKTLEELNLNHAVIRIPVNVSYVPLNNWKQPPWLQW